MYIYYITYSALWSTPVQSKLNTEWRAVKDTLKITGLQRTCFFRADWRKMTCKFSKFKRVFDCTLHSIGGSDLYITYITMNCL